MKTRFERIRSKLIMISLCLVLLGVSGATFAWYTRSENVTASRENIEIMTPYFLYLLNPGTSDSLEYTIGNIHPSETKQTVICVSNKKPADVEDDNIDIARVSDFTYELEFITTNNLEVDYEIYELSMHKLADGESAPAGAITMPEVSGLYWTKVGNALEGVDTSKDRHMSVFGAANPSGVVNSGKYTLYSKDSTGRALHLSYSGSSYDYDYYLIEIDWIDESSFENSLKETDVNYVVVNAMQPEPVAD